MAEDLDALFEIGARGSAKGPHSSLMLIIGGLAILVAILLGVAVAPWKPEEVANYDPLRDETRCTTSIHLGNALAQAGRDVEGRLYLSLTGKGKHPTEWSAYMSFSLDGVPSDRPLILGERTKIKIPPFKEFDVLTSKYDRDGGRTREESASVSGYGAFANDGITIDDFVALAERGTLEINGTRLTLAPAQMEELRKMIIAAREATNAAK
jgi:hypothetical protein